MNLKTYCGKNVNITTKKGNLFSGEITDYFYPEDNESNLESVVMETSSGDLIEFTSDNIEKITVI